MKIGKRFLVWSLLGIFITTGLGSVGHAVQASTTDAPASWVAIEATQVAGSEPATGDPGVPAINSPNANTAEDLQNPGTPESIDELSPAHGEDRGTLNLPDFEPTLPGETVLDETASETDESGWREGEIESTGQQPPELTEAQKTLIAADKYYLTGDRATAEQLYRQVKDATWQVDATNLRPAPIFDAAELSAAAGVYWREAQAGYAQGLSHRTTVPLELLVEEYPEFIPGHIFYADYLVEQDRAEEADTVLDRALISYPSEPTLLQARTSTQMELEHWIEAAITARQFAVLNPDHPEAETMATLGNENMDRFRSEMRAELTQNFIGNLLIGTAGAVLTGGLVGPYTALNSAMLLLQGESAVGAGAAEQIKGQIPIMTDPKVNEYLDTMGQTLAHLAGRDEFDYDFYAVEDADLNAFALPGGKVFVNAGALMQAHSEAEMAGLMAHEISHAVLSHGFQMVTNGNLINSLASMIPIPEVGGLAAGLAFSSYSRQMERQADILGTQILSAAGYAADGLHNLMVTLEEESGDRDGIQWFSSHPAPAKRIDYLKRIVEQGGYNRYAYEGMETHLAMQQRVNAIMDQLNNDAEASDDGTDESDALETGSTPAEIPADPVEDTIGNDTETP